MLRLGQPLTDTGQHLLFKSAIGQRFRQLSRKGVNNHLLRGLLVYPARAQVEHLLIVNTPDRRAVAAFYVVRIDFQLWFASTSARRPSKRLLLVICPSVLMACCATLIRPLNTARPLSLTMVLCS